MSDNKSFQQRIKKFSKFITKVKEKTQHVFHEEEQVVNTGIIRRHSSYIQQPSPIDEFTNTNFFDNQSRLKQEDTLPSNTTSALSPPPRQLKKDRQKNINYQNRYSSPQIASKPCLSRSNTLGHHPIKFPPPPLHNTTTNSSTSLSSLSGQS